MGRVDLADMLLSFYRIPCKTKRWHQKIFWHLSDMTKINAWILYRRHFRQNGKPHKNHVAPQLSLELSDHLILTNKVNPSISRRGPSTRRSLEAPTTGKNPTQALPVSDVCFDQVAHWPSPITNKNVFNFRLIYAHFELLWFYGFKF